MSRHRFEESDHLELIDRVLLFEATVDRMLDGVAERLADPALPGEDDGAEEVSE